MTANATPELLARIAQKKTDMETARRGMREGIKYSSRSLGGHTTQFRRLCRLAGIKVKVSRPEPTSIVITGKPCRYKACKGRDHKAHGEKCPVASARGKTGGTMGTGEVKARNGEINGRFVEARPCGCPQRQHKITCEHARISTAKIALWNQRLHSERSVRKTTNTNPISWRAEALSTGGVAMMLRGIQGVCSGCSKEMPAILAAKVHREDIHEARMRIICDACEAQ